MSTLIVAVVILAAAIWVVLHVAAKHRGDWDHDRWRRCTTCEGLLVRVTPDTALQNHIGHRLQRAAFLNLSEYLRVTVGLL